MNSETELIEPEDSVEIIEDDDSTSVEDFIKELEAKEKDLHITADYRIEVSGSGFEMVSTPEVVSQDLPAAIEPVMPTVAAPSAGTKTRVYEFENKVESLQKKIAEVRIDRNGIQEKSDRRLN